MKYLMIHKFIWFILVLTCTIIQGSFIYLVALPIYLLWNLKFPKDWWGYWIYTKGFGYRGEVYGNWNYGDKNPWETIKRRYNIFF